MLCVRVSVCVVPPCMCGGVMAGVAYMRACVCGGGEVMVGDSSMCERGEPHAA